MAGKKLVDLAALVNASRPVVQHHIALRKSQLDVFAMNSSLVKAVKLRTDPIIQTIRAAAYFSQRLGGSSKRYHSTISSGRGLDLLVSNRWVTIDSQQGRSSSSQGRRQAQRQSESPIPSSATTPSSNDLNDPDAASLTKDHDQDVFYTRIKESGPVFSELPRSKIPKHTEVAQRVGDQGGNSGAINSEFFYSSKGHQDAESLPKVEAVPERDQVPDGINTDVFHSPRVAKLVLTREEGNKANGKGDLGLKGASGTPVEHIDLAGGEDQDTFNVRSSQQDEPTRPEASIAGNRNLSKPDGEKDEMRNLGAEMTKETQQGSAKTKVSLGYLSEEISHKDDADMLIAPGQESLLDTKDEPPSTSSRSFEMNESKVPSSRLGRLWHYGGLATGMALGAVGEGIRRATGSQSGASGERSSPMMSPANMDRLVAKLSRMRGAALKLGQMVSFQDSSMFPGPVQQVLQRVQDSADYMPISQRNEVLAGDLGADWRDLFSSFDDIPLAAASIGQVHGAVLRSSGQRVAVKVQYPGVAESIDSDLNNLSILLTASRLLPKGLYLDKTINNARKELGWECDYVREAACAKRFKTLLQDDPEDAFVVPRIIDSASGKAVLTMERMEGIAVTKLLPGRLGQAERDWIGTQILRLCLRELMEFRFMQTDPNWTNFLYNGGDGRPKIELLDFGASRDFPNRFVDPYIALLEAAADSNEERCLDLSVQLGYLTGHESRVMREAHLKSLFVLAEPFSSSSTSSSSMSISPNGDGENSDDGERARPREGEEEEDEKREYDFSNQTITSRIRDLIPVMLSNRLTPPPEESYSLHRKLSGAFLLLARLGASVPCRRLFVDALSTRSSSLG